MMRKEKEITEKSRIEDILRRALVCRIAMSFSDEPYVAPVCFGYEGDKIYIHSAREGKKIDILRKNNRVCFEASVDVELTEGKLACDFSMKFRSVIGFGKARFIEDPSEKAAALDVIMRHYGRMETESYNEKILGKTQLIVIEIDSMTGKESKK
jgi:nitroimidazol reductase NimA-like FMN-containing flavoprotein (pyridoxamine 5'-phosphate oxidase superfamily)